MHIYINCFNRLRYLAAVSTELQKKSTFLENLRTITLEGNMEPRQVTPFFSSTFSVLNVHSFLNLKILKIHFHVVPPLVHSGL